METDQITKNITDEESSQVTDLQTPAKAAKDPKKVAAGKALAKKNAEGRKAFIKQDEESSQEESSTPVDVSTIYNGIKSIAGIVGTGFTLYHGWKIYESYRKNEVEERVELVEPATPKIKRNHPVNL